MKNRSGEAPYRRIFSSGSGVVHERREKDGPREAGLGARASGQRRVRSSGRTHLDVEEDDEEAGLTGRARGGALLRDEPEGSWIGRLGRWKEGERSGEDLVLVTHEGTKGREGARWEEEEAGGGRRSSGALAETVAATPVAQFEEAGEEERVNDKVRESESESVSRSWAKVDWSTWAGLGRSGLAWLPL